MKELIGYAWNKTMQTAKTTEMSAPAAVLLSGVALTATAVAASIGLVICATDRIIRSAFNSKE